MDKKGTAGIRTQVARIRTSSDNQLHYSATDDIEASPNIIEIKNMIFCG